MQGNSALGIGFTDNEVKNKCTSRFRPRNLVMNIKVKVEQFCEVSGRFFAEWRNTELSGPRSAGTLYIWYEGEMFVQWTNNSL